MTEQIDLSIAYLWGAIGRPHRCDTVDQLSKWFRGIGDHAGVGGYKPRRLQLRGRR